MKKIKSLFIAPLALVSLMASSCSSGSSKIALIFGDKNASDVVEITYNDLKSKIEEKETFILTVQPDTACYCWSDFYPIVKNYLTEKHLIVYHIKYDAFGDKDNLGLNIRKGYTSFAISENGEWKQNLISDGNDIFKSADKFSTYMSEVAYLPHYFFVNLEDVNNMRKSEEQSVVYFARSNCPDCSYVDKTTLREFAKNNIYRKDMYILDCENIGIREYVDDKKSELTPESKVAWANFKMQYGLANNYNETYGYDSGYVPTFQVIKAENGETKYVSGCVYFNDTLEKRGDNYYVKTSFYSEKRAANLQYLSDFSGTKVLEGLEVSKDDAKDYGGYIAWNQKAQSKYHAPLLEAFLNYYVK